MIRINKHPLALRVVIVMASFAFAAVGFSANVNSADIGSADADGGGTERQRLEDVGSSAKAAVDQDRHAPRDRLDDLG